VLARAGELHRLAGEARGARDHHLARRRELRAGAGLAQSAREAHARVRLQRVQHLHAVAERRPYRGEPRARDARVVHEERRAEARGEVIGGDAADAQRPRVGGQTGEEACGRRVHAAGFITERRPDARPVADGRAPARVPAAPTDGRCAPTARSPANPSVTSSPPARGPRPPRERAQAPSSSRKVRAFAIAWPSTSLLKYAYTRSASRAASRSTRARAASVRRW